MTNPARYGFEKGILLRDAAHKGVRRGSLEEIKNERHCTGAKLLLHRVRRETKRKRRRERRGPSERQVLVGMFSAQIKNSLPLSRLYSSNAVECKSKTPDGSVPGSNAFDEGSKTKAARL